MGNSVTLEIMRQETFDTVWNGVIQQGRICRSPNGGCAYRDADAHCAVGHVLKGKIHEDHNAWRFRGNLQGLRAHYPEMKSILEDVEFLSELQEAHDGSVDVEDFKILMARVAKRYHIKVPG